MSRFDLWGLLDVPDAFKDELLVSENISVEAFVNLSLPIFGGLGDSKDVKVCREVSQPAGSTLDLVLLKSKPVPDLDTLENLEQECLRFVHYGFPSYVQWGESEKFEPWVIGYWREIHKLQGLKVDWTQGYNRIKELKEAPDNNLHDRASQISQIFGKLPWKARLSLELQKRAFDTSNLTKFLLECSWLTDNEIDIMIDILHIKHLSGKNSTSAVFGINFSTHVLKDNIPNDPKPIAELVGLVQLSKIIHLYFPLNVGGNHWIAVHVDFYKNIFEYGDSMETNYDEKDNPFHPKMSDWLHRRFSRLFQFKGNTLVHARQRDTHNCGFYAVNTIEHAISGEALLPDGYSARYRLDWFLAAAAYVTVSPVAGNTTQKALSQAPYSSFNWQSIRRETGIPNPLAGSILSNTIDGPGWAEICNAVLFTGLERNALSNPDSSQTIAHLSSSNHFTRAAVVGLQPFTLHEDGTCGQCVELLDELLSYAAFRMTMALRAFFEDQISTDPSPDEWWIHHIFTDYNIRLILGIVCTYGYDPHIPIILRHVVFLFGLLGPKSSRGVGLPTYSLYWAWLLWGPPAREIEMFEPGPGDFRNWWEDRTCRTSDISGGISHWWFQYLRIQQTGICALATGKSHARPEASSINAVTMSLFNIAMAYQTVNDLVPGVVNLNKGLRKQASFSYPTVIPEVLESLVESSKIRDKLIDDL